MFVDTQSCQPHFGSCSQAEALRGGSSAKLASLRPVPCQRKLILAWETVRLHLRKIHQLCRLVSFGINPDFLSFSSSCGGWGVVVDWAGVCSIPAVPMLIARTPLDPGSPHGLLCEVLCRHIAAPLPVIPLLSAASSSRLPSAGPEAASAPLSWAELCARQT